MLKIRQAQMDTLESIAIIAFEDRTYAHLQEHFPGPCELLDEKQMREVIQQGWAKSKQYGFTAECCVRMYIEFMCLLGGCFDTDPLLPWAAEILNEPRSADQVARGDRFHARAWEYLDHIAADYRDADGALSTARFTTELEQLQSAPGEPLASVAMQPYAQMLMNHLERALPAKFHYVGAERVRALILAGARTAAGHGLVDTRGAAIFVALQFALGSGFDRDPLLPWASATLSKLSLRDPRRKADRLYVKALGMPGFARDLP